MAPSVTPGPQTQPIIETQYRLHPADLDGKPRQAQIANVTFQGIEAMQPVLHFTGHAKRLTLTPAQSRQMVTITGTTIVTQWIGARIVLTPRREQGIATIHISAPEPRRRLNALPTPTGDDRRGWRTALIFVATAMTFSIGYTILTALPLADWLAQLETTLRAR